jgi:hypothetical protein
VGGDAERQRDRALVLPSSPTSASIRPVRPESSATCRGARARVSCSLGVVFLCAVYTAWT